MQNNNNQLEDAVMGKTISRIPEMLVKKGWDTKTFVANCMLAGMSQQTAYRLAGGDMNVRLSSLEVAAQVLGTSIGEIIKSDEQ
jgi:DNA-binding Xre family transcriptional regulator